jgi:hypothetical protein
MHMLKWARILLALGIGGVAIGIYLSCFGMQTASALVVHYKYRKMPEAEEIPAPLADLSISNVPHTKVSYFGYEFELPWDDIDEQKSKTTGPIHLAAFRSGNVFWFSTFPPREFVNGIMKEFKLDAQDFRHLVGDEAFESDYSFHKKMLQTKPSDITPFVSRREAARGMMLLLLKATSMPKADSGIFSIRTAGFDGFQFESPDARPFRITDELYSDTGGIDVMFLQKAGGSAPAISQAEINRVIQSIHKTASSTVTAPTTAK